MGHSLLQYMGTKKQPKVLIRKFVKKSQKLALICTVVISKDVAFSRQFTCSVTFGMGAMEPNQATALLCSGIERREVSNSLMTQSH